MTLRFSSVPTGGVGTVPQIRSWPFPLVSFPIHYSLIILPFRAVWSPSLTASLNKPLITEANVLVCLFEMLFTSRRNVYSLAEVTLFRCPPISSAAPSSSPPLFAIIRNQDSVQLQTNTVSCIAGRKSTVPNKQRVIRKTCQFLDCCYNRETKLVFPNGHFSWMLLRTFGH